MFFQDNKADLVTLDAGEVYSAVKQFGLAAVAKEIYSDGRNVLYEKLGLNNLFVLALKHCFNTVIMCVILQAPVSWQWQ